MSFFGDLYRGTTNVDFPRLWRRTVVISLVLVVISIGALAVRGLNLGIDFEGGTSLEVRADASVSDVKTTFESRLYPRLRCRRFDGLRQLCLVRMNPS